MSTTKTFIPLEDISTVVINEGLTKWSVRYYLSVIRKNGAGVVVAFDVSGIYKPCFGYITNIDFIAGGLAAASGLAGGVSWYQRVALRRVGCKVMTSSWEELITSLSHSQATAPFHRCDRILANVRLVQLDLKVRSWDTHLLSSTTMA